ncbi:DUF2913 family protein [Enterobacter asburiae]|uniref:DUF2913 family protein n=1 Tax=Enterobacter asburiae TaxID=61645 RepID=UPI001E5B658E|nr:DUF2913 family protein [Enterobacter asburiae]MCE2003841.1 DUF2913 family protein [Enterobacter asburiae]
MNKDNLNVSHLAWCGLIALHTARRDGLVTSPAQVNLFLTRWLATAEKQRRFPREMASDISWLLKQGREKGLRADLPGKLEYLWRAGNGRRQRRLSPSVSGVYLRRSALETGLDEHGRQRSPLPARITGDLGALDNLLQRSGWPREAADGQDHQLHTLIEYLHSLDYPFANYLVITN